MIVYRIRGTLAETLRGEPDGLQGPIRYTEGI